MKLLSVFRVSLREQLRSPWDLVLVLVLIPGMLLMYWFMASGGSTSYAVLVVNHDVGACPVGDTTQPCAGQAIERMKQLSYESGNPMLRVSTLGSRAEAEQKLISEGKLLAADAGPKPESNPFVRDLAEFLTNDGGTARGEPRGMESQQPKATMSGRGRGRPKRPEIGSTLHS